MTHNIIFAMGAPITRAEGPTGRLRMAVPNMRAYGQQPSCARLQQEWHVQIIGGPDACDRLEWRDVPFVEVETP